MLINEIDTRHGTHNDPSFSHGNTLPYTGVPFGMNYFAVQSNRHENAWWFDPTSHQFAGIRLTHQPSPWIGDFSQLLMTATSGDLNYQNLGEITGSYRPSEAIFNPHYLKVYDQRYGITSELTPTTYGAVMRYQFQRQNNQLLIQVPKKAHFEISDDHHYLTFKVMNYETEFDADFAFYGAIAFDQSIQDSQLKYLDNPDYTVLELHFGNINSLSCHLGTSFINHQQAKLALANVQKQSFNEVYQNAKNAWQEKLDLIEIQDQNIAHKNTFYHCLYRTFLFPQKAYELDQSEQPIHYDLYNQTVKPGFLYMNNGFWDTSKTVYPLFSLLIPDTYRQMLAGFYNTYLESGYLPKWLAPDERGMMPGTLIDATIADAVVKKIVDKTTAQQLLDAMLVGANQQSSNPRFGRSGTKDYQENGFLAYDKHHESVNHTLDYAYSDFCISQVARVLGQKPIVEKYQKLALNYQYLFDQTTGLMRPKDSQNQFMADFETTRWGGAYTEGSAWQNSFAVYHDINGLKQRYAQHPSFEETLLQLVNQTPDYQIGSYGFEIHEMTEMAAIDFGQIAISNQPSFHLPYLFMYSTKPEYTSLLIKQLTTTFNSGIDGFPGDEDNGSMSAWYIFSTLGFYPVCPGTDEYVLGSPLFDRVALHLPDQKTFEIITNRNQSQNQFVQSRQLNHQTFNNRVIKHDEIIKGGQLQTTMSLLPNPSAYNQDLPFSLS